MHHFHCVEFLRETKSHSAFPDANNSESSCCMFSFLSPNSPIVHFSNFVHLVHFCHFLSFSYLIQFVDSLSFFPDFFDCSQSFWVSGCVEVGGWVVGFQDSFPGFINFLFEKHQALDSKPGFHQRVGTL